mgnify:CR=1 FL=1
MRIATICGSCHKFFRGPVEDHPCVQDRMKRSEGVQVGMIDGEQIGYFPPEAGPYVDPGNSIKRVLKNNYAWKEMIKRSEGNIGDVS